MAGYQIVAAFELWRPAIDVYRENFAHPVHEINLAETVSVKLVEEYSPALIIGGPPCQDFSSASASENSGERANLTKSFASIVCRVRPQVFVFENVPRARLSSVYKSTTKSYRRAGYGLTEVVLDAALCGVPQSRKRLFLIGLLGGVDGELTSSLITGQQKTPLSMREYFGGELKIDHYFRVPTNYTKRGVFSVDEPCTTIRGIDRPIPSGYRPHKNDSAHILKDKVRGLTVDERARVQTFPKSFKWKGAKTNLNTMIGNAVPVNLAKYVAVTLKKRLEKRTDEK
jgi:DNA (cytosine-5)-methyltransferase 1